MSSNFKDKWPLGTWAYDTPRLIEGNPDFPNAKLNSETPFTMDNGYGKAFSLLRELNEKGYLEKDINSTNWEQSKRTSLPANSPCTILATGLLTKSSEQALLQTMLASSHSL